jgi:hypothetical protein
MGSEIKIPQKAVIPAKALREPESITRLIRLDAGSWPA